MHDHHARHPDLTRERIHFDFRNVDPVGVAQAGRLKRNVGLQPRGLASGKRKTGHPAERARDVRQRDAVSWYADDSNNAIDDLEV
jgi:hypothetical protein